VLHARMRRVSAGPGRGAQRSVCETDRVGPSGWGGRAADPPGRCRVLVAQGHQIVHRSRGGVLDHGDPPTGRHHRDRSAPRWHVGRDRLPDCGSAQVAETSWDAIGW